MDIVKHRVIFCCINSIEVFWWKMDQLGPNFLSLWLLCTLFGELVKRGFHCIMDCCIIIASIKYLAFISKYQTCSHSCISQWANKTMARDNVIYLATACGLILVVHLDVNNDVSKIVHHTTLSAFSVVTWGSESTFIGSSSDTAASFLFCIEEKVKFLWDWIVVIYSWSIQGLQMTFQEHHIHGNKARTHTM